MTKRTDTKETIYKTLAAFRKALREFLHFSEEMAHRAGISPQQHQALLAIRGFPHSRPFTITDLASHLQITHHSAVGLADRLEKEKYLLRKTDSGDRRKVNLCLTRRGMKILEKLSHSNSQELRVIGPKLIRILQSLIAETKS